MKVVLIAAILILSINGCSDKSMSLGTPTADHIKERTNWLPTYSRCWWQYFWEGDYYNSLEILSRALELLELQDLYKQIAYYYSRVGRLHKQLGNDERAEYYFNKAISLTQADTGNGASERLRALRAFVTLHASRDSLEQFETTMDAILDTLPLQQQYQVHYNAAQSDKLTQQTEDVLRAHGVIFFLVIILLLVIALSIVAILFYRSKGLEAVITVRHYEELLKYKKETHNQRSSSEKTDTSKQLASEIQKLFEIEKIYRQQGLSVDDVSKRIQTSSRQLSNVISQHYQKNFTEYANTFRVEEAIEMLKQQGEGGKYANYTIQAIGETVGFNGRSSFYTAFKRIIGVTPSEYMNVLNATAETKSAEAVK